MPDDKRAATAALLAGPSVMDAICSLQDTIRWSTPWLLPMEPSRLARLVLLEPSVSACALGMNGGLGEFAGATGCFAEARSLLATAMGASDVFMLTEGSTSGNAIVSRYLKKQHAVVLTAAASHHSVTHALTADGVSYVRASFGYDQVYEEALPPTPDQLARLLSHYADVTHVWIVSPSYGGAHADLPALAAICAARGVTLLVDQAWGSANPYDAQLPANAVDAGAAIGVTSMHKGAGSIQGTAVLSYDADQVDVHKLRAAYDETISTSPSALALAYMDYANREMIAFGPAILRRVSDVITALREGAAARLGLPAFDGGGTFQLDPGRVTFNLDGYATTGFELRDRLAKHGVCPEKAGLRTITFLGTPQLPCDAAARTLDALAETLEEPSTRAVRRIFRTASS